MKYSNERNGNSLQSVCIENLKADCKKCFGFCCVALYFSCSEGFPIDKEAGKPCINLKLDFNCSVHKNLKELGLKGCTAYDCFGAGQKTAQVTYEGHDWRQNPETAKQMFDVFLNMRQLHEMLWYLKEALNYNIKCNLEGELKSIFNDTERLTFLSPEELLKLDLAEHGTAVNALILQFSEMFRSKVSIEKSTSSTLKRKKTLGRGLDFIGADLRKYDLRGENLRGAYLIAADLREIDLSWADLMGADLRDVDIRGANLRSCIFLTQAQVNTAKGDSSTKISNLLTRPTHW